MFKCLWCLKRELILCDPLPSLINGIALLVPSISAGPGSWERRLGQARRATSMLAAAAERPRSAWPHRGESSPGPLELGFIQGRDGAGGEAEPQRGGEPGRLYWGGSGRAETPSWCGPALAAPVSPPASPHCRAKRMMQTWEASLPPQCCLGEGSLYSKPLLWFG